MQYKSIAFFLWIYYNSMLLGVKIMSQIEFEKIEKYLKNRRREDLIDRTMLKRVSLNKVKKIMDLEVWTNPRFEHLLSKDVWHSNVDQINAILSMKEWDNPKFAELLVPSIWHCRYCYVYHVLHLDAWKDEKLKPLLTPRIWVAKCKYIEKLLGLKYWQDDTYKDLLTETLLDIDPDNVEKNMTTLSDNGIEKYATLSLLRMGPIDLKLRIEEMKERKIPLILRVSKSDPTRGYKLNPLLLYTRVKYNELIGNVEVNTGRVRCQLI